MTDLILFLYILAGIVTGFVGALLGAGGGFIMVPILNLLFGFEIHQAIGTSLFTVAFTSLSGCIEYLRKRMVDISLGATMIPFTILGAVIGANISTLIPGRILQAVFGIVLFIASVRMFLKQDKSAPQSNISSKLSSSKFLSFNRTFTNPDGTTFEYAVNLPLIATFGFCVGLMSGLLGIGGGIVQVPVLALVFGVPIHVSIATSLFIIIFTSSFGMLTHLFLGNVLITEGIFLAIGTVIGGQIGARTTQKIEKGILRKIFAVVMALTGIRMFISLFFI